MRNILIVNRLNTDNLGDQIIAKTMKQLFSDDEVVVNQADYIFTPERTYNRYVDRLLRFIYKQKCKRMIRESDCVIFGGGELISSSETFFSTFVEWNRLIDKSNGKKIKFLFSVGIEGEFSEFQKEQLTKILKNYSGIYVRDEKSYQLLLDITDSLYIHKIHMMPDCVFALKQEYKSPKKNIALLGITSIERHNKHNKLHFNNKCDLYDYYYKRLNDIRTSYNIDVSVIYNTRGDRKVAYEFKEYLKLKKNDDVCIINTDTNEKLIESISKATMVISPRMHACIVALVYNCKVMPVVLSKKMENFDVLYIKNKRNIQELRASVKKEKENLLSQM